MNEYERWQDCFSGQDYAFGKEPNYFLNPASNYFPDLVGRWRLRMARDAMAFGSLSRD